MDNKLIYERHDNVTEKLESIRYSILKTLRYGNKDLEALIELLDDIDSKLYDCIEEITLAKESGQKMENKLLEYRSAIENLGFVRKGDDK